jgi:hypothetical protein
MHLGRFVRIERRCLLRTVRVENQADLAQSTFQIFSDLHRLRIARHVIKHRTEILPVALGDGGVTQVCGLKQSGEEGEVSTMSATAALVLDGVSDGFANKRTYQVGSPDHADTALDRDLDAL